MPPMQNLDQANLRTVIDAVAMVRAQSARLGFSALQACARGGAADIEAVRAARQAVARGLDLVAGGGPIDGHAPANLAWLRTIAADEPGLLDRFRTFDALAEELLSAAGQGEVTVALAHRIVIAGGDEFYDATTRLMVLLWTDLETQRIRSVAEANAAVDAAGRAFKDLSVRAAEAHSLAMNARIEVARTKDPAFAVIAREVGELANDIRAMSRETGKALEDARKRLRGD